VLDAQDSFEIETLTMTLSRMENSSIKSTTAETRERFPPLSTLIPRKAEREIVEIVEHGPQSRQLPLYVFRRGQRRVFKIEHVPTSTCAS